MKRHCHIEDSTHVSASRAVVYDTGLIFDFFTMKTEQKFENVLVHLMEPVIQSVALQDERSGWDAEDHDVHSSLADEP